MTHLRQQVVQPQDESIRLIPLTQGQVAIVDAADFDWLNQWKWHAHWSEDSKSYYAQRGINLKPGTKIIKMHRLILGLSAGVRCDHRNRNTLDNRRENLRHATPQFGANRISPGTDQEIIKRGDTHKRGKLFPNKGADDVADFAARRAFPLYDRTTQAGQRPSLASFAGLAGVSVNEKKKKK